MGGKALRNNYSKEEKDNDYNYCGLYYYDEIQCVYCKQKKSNRYMRKSFFTQTKIPYWLCDACRVRLAGSYE